jgi:SAM-dependent methyltransferase
LQRSLFDLDRPGEYDIAIVDGVSFVTADTERALKSVATQVKLGGVLLFSLTNVWGRFWWFGAARTFTRALGGSDFHKRAAWGRRLFHWTRRSQEGTTRDAAFYRSDESWAYDWFGPPAYHLHSPAEIRGWMAEQGLEHLASVPSLQRKDPPVTVAARILRYLTGEGPRAMGLYWLANRAPNMVYVSAVRTR